MTGMKGPGGSSLNLEKWISYVQIASSHYISARKVLWEEKSGAAMRTRSYQSRLLSKRRLRHDREVAWRAELYRPV